MAGEKRLDRLAWRLYHLGIRPDHVTLMQVPVYLGMIYSGFAAAHDFRYLFIFGTLQILVVVLDGADGMLARRTGTATSRGHLLDSLFDITGIGITLWVASHLYPHYAQLALGLLLVNFLVYLQNEIQGTKSITYTRGPVTLGMVIEYWYPGLLLWAMVMPLGIGALLMLSRVDWRRRVWNWYRYITGGQRREYKQTPRVERARLPHPEPRRTPTGQDWASVGRDDEQPGRSGRGAGPEKPR